MIEIKNKFKQYLPPIIFFLFIIWMVIQADNNQSNLIMEIGRSVPAGDKIGHFILFGLLALLLNMALRFRQIQISRRRFHLGSVIVLTFAMIEELSQLGFESRTFDLVDMLFDLFGIGVLSSVAFRKFCIRKLQALIQSLDKGLNTK